STNAAVSRRASARHPARLATTPDARVAPRGFRSIRRDHFATRRPFRAGFGLVARLRRATPWAHERGTPLRGLNRWRAPLRRRRLNTGRIARSDAIRDAIYFAAGPFRTIQIGRGVTQGCAVGSRKENAFSGLIIWRAPLRRRRLSRACVTRFNRRRRSGA